MSNEPEESQTAASTGRQPSETEDPVLMRLNYSVTPDAVWSFLKQSRRMQLKSVPRIAIRVLALVAVMYWITTNPSFARIQGWEYLRWGAGLIGVIAALAFMRGFDWLSLKAMMARLNPNGSASFQTTVYADRIDAERDDGQQVGIHFNSLRLAAADESYSYLFAGPFKGFVIPKDAFSDEDERKRLISIVQEFREGKASGRPGSG